MTPDSLDLDLPLPGARPIPVPEQASEDRASAEDIFTAELALWRSLCPPGRVTPAWDAAFVLAAARAARAALELLPGAHAALSWERAPGWLADLALRPDDASLHQALERLEQSPRPCAAEAFRLFDSLVPVAAPAEALMVTDGDPRARLDPETGLNRYGCRAVAGGGALALSACTANEPTAPGLAAAEKVRGHLMAAALDGRLDQAAADHAQNQKERILARLGLDGLGTPVMLTSSGTEAARQAALCAHDALKPAVALVVGPLETGREIVQAVSDSPFCESVQSVAIRDAETGIPIDPARLTETIAGLVEKARAKDFDVVLHVLEGSKTGLAAPGIDGVRALLARFPQGLKVVADFCQMRPFGDARPYLELGAAIVATGSKFMGGPAFSGALILPASWPVLAAPPVPTPGILLRWEAALAESEAFWRLDPLHRAVGLSRFAKAVREAAADFTEVDVLDDGQPGHILALRVLDTETGGWMDHKDLERLNRWLAQDARPLLPSRAQSFEIRLARQRCLLGQPVMAGPHGALRLAVNAGKAALLADAPSATAQLHQDVVTVLSKIALIRRYWPKSN